MTPSFTVRTLQESSFKARLSLGPFSRVLTLVTVRWRHSDIAKAYVWQARGADCSDSHVQELDLHTLAHAQNVYSRAQNSILVVRAIERRIEAQPEAIAEFIEDSTH